MVETALGTVEYSIRGKAPYLLALHGSPGLHDGVVGLFTPWLEQGFGVIAPSRPGYGRTTSKKTYSGQADLFAALLDTLKVKKVVVYGISGGGPPAIEFAVRHKSRTHALLTQVACTGGLKHRGVEDMKSSITRFIMTSPLFPFLLTKLSPAKIISGLLKEMSTFSTEEKAKVVEEIVADPRRMKLMPLLREASCIMPAYPHIYDTVARETHMIAWTLPLEKVEVPTLIAHGTADGDVPYW